LPKIWLASPFMMEKNIKLNQNCFWWFVFWHLEGIRATRDDRNNNGKYFAISLRTHKKKDLFLRPTTCSLEKKRISIVRKCFMFFGVGKCYAFSKYVYNNPTLLISVDLETFFHRSSSFQLPSGLPLWKNKITDFLLLFRNAVKMKCRTTRQKVNRKNIFFGTTNKESF